MVDWTEKKVILYFQTEHGAEPATLLRRTSYGGRKGRSAAKRLQRMPQAVVQTAVAFAHHTAPAETEPTP